MSAKENGEEIEFDSEPGRDPLSSQPETNINGTKRMTRVPTKITKREINSNSISRKPSRIASTKLQFNTNKTSPKDNTNALKKSPKPNNPININNSSNNTDMITSKIANEKTRENEIKDIISEETISITSEETKEVVDILDEAPNCDQSNSTDTETPDREEDNIITNRDQVLPNNGALYLKIEEMETKLERLQMELCEAGIVEFAIYSVVSEHDVSDYKVHTPARRLSRFYIYSCENWSKDKMASLTKNITSGIVRVAKSCGHDVSRLTFWLSNIIVLREMISQNITGVRKNSVSKPTNNNETSAFISALEKMESWIFSRVVESVWWQVIAPPMQSQVGKQGNNPTNLWINAFNNAFTKLCPIRNGALKCGCIKQVSKMVMEECIARLDVAMFNAILRESINEMPTDPISDPISNPKVLPVPPGDFTFGSGAQLRNSIGHWSISLDDMFGVDVKYFNFPLLNELSELLMLPKDMLLDMSIREEVCPSFGVKLIIRILLNFQPDELCPDSVPGFLLEELNSESIIEEVLAEKLITNIPLAASPISYYRPPSADVAQACDKIDELDKKGSFDKDYKNDDDLDYLDSSLASIIDKYDTENERYKLLREIWS